MKWAVVIVVGLLSGSASGQGYEDWVEHEFPAAYEKFQKCMPMTVRWESQSGDWVEANVWRERGDTYLNTVVPIVSGQHAKMEALTIVDADSDGHVNQAKLQGEVITGERLQQYPMVGMILHTVVAVASYTGQCGD